MTVRREMFKRVAGFLADEALGAGALTDSICEGLVVALKETLLADRPDVRFSIDLFSPDEKSWCIQASTDPQTARGQVYDQQQGLTGWVMRTKRRVLHARDPGDLPLDLGFIPGYKDVRSAFLYLCRIDRKARGCLCAVSTKPGGLEDELATAFLRLGTLIELFLSEPSLTPDLQATPPESPPPSIWDEKDLPHWLGRRLPQHYRWANLWMWNGAREHLVPTQVSPELQELGSGWLRPLKLGEGFVGSCAERLELLLESRIDRGEGRTTGIRTPLDEICPGKKLRSMLALPVKDPDRFYGVLAILSDSPNYFREEDVAQLEKVCRETGEVLRASMDRRLSEIDREVRDRLAGALIGPLKPSEFWVLLSEILYDLVKCGLCLRASLLVGKRHTPDVFTVKSRSSTDKKDPPILNASQDALLRMLLRAEAGERRVGDLPPGSSRALLVDPQASCLWSEHSSVDLRNKSLPTFLAAVSLRRRTIRDESFGLRAVDDRLAQIFASIFATARAILTTADWAEQNRRRAWLMASETHDLRQPLSTIKQNAETLKELDENSQVLVLADRIVRAADELLVKMENNQYANWFMTPDADPDNAPSLLDSRSVFDLSDFLAELVREVQDQHPHVFVAYEAPARSAQYFVHGRRRWLRVALRNVLDNAVKFGSEAPVNVRLRRESEKAQGSASLELRNYLVVEIEDHGIGIPETERKAIFVRGHRNSWSRKFEVTGAQIALSVTKDIVTQHGGEVWVTSELRKGSTFFLKFPALDPGAD